MSGLLKVYAYCVMLVIVFVVEFGFVLPFLISYDSDILVMVGVLLICVTLPAYYLVAKRVYNMCINLNSKYDEEKVS